VTIARRRYLPYSFARHGLELIVVALRVGEEVIDLGEAYDEDRRILDLKRFVGEGNLFVEAEVRGLTESLFLDTFPPRELEAPPVRLALVGQDEKGWYRVAVPMARRGETARGLLEIVPAHGTGAMSVEAVAMRTADAPLGSDVRYAGRAGMRVATSSPISLSLREIAQPPGGALDVRWEDFSGSSHPRRRARPGRIFYLEPTAEPPILWLNKGVDDLAAVLESKGTRGPRARTRDLIHQVIALPVWYALVHHASAAVTAGEDVEGWRRGLLAQIAPRVYPGLRRETAYKQLIEDLLIVRDDAGSSGSALIEKLLAAIEDEVDLVSVVTRAIRGLST